MIFDILKTMECYDNVQQTMILLTHFLELEITECIRSDFFPSCLKDDFESREFMQGITKQPHLRYLKEVRIGHASFYIGDS